MIRKYFQGMLYPLLRVLIQKFGTPFHIYDEAGIRMACQRLKKAFDGIPFRNYYAVKANPNPAILEIIQSEGFGFDCSSVPEVMLARHLGASSRDVMFTSNNTSYDEFRFAVQKGGKECGCILNLDDITLVSKVPGKFPHTICFRYNPGDRRTGNEIIGKPLEAKYGVTHDQIVEAYRLAIKCGAKRFGLHTMICSNELNGDYMVETVKMLLDVVRMISKELGIKFDFINMGGGIGIPYKPEQKEVDIEKMAEEIKVLMFAFNDEKGYMPELNMECGRFITGPHGVLITKVINHKHIYREYVGVDACMSSLMRPALYGAYHHIEVLCARGRPIKFRDQVVVDVTGSLCENNDKLAVQRLLPKTETGDIMVIQDTGAHGIAMCFNYNGRLRPAEFLLHVDGSVSMISRAETPQDLFMRYKKELVHS